MNNSSELAFRRQFLLSPIPCDRLETWEKTLLSSYTLYIHRDCSWVRADRETDDEHSFDSVVVTGYMIDPYQPESTTKNLARDLVRLGTTKEVAERLYTLGGRFVLFITKGEQLFLFHDAGGLKSVFYIWHKGRFHAASQPLLLDLVVPLKKAGAYGQYFGSAFVQNTKDHVPPTGMPLFDGVNQLVPNHYYDTEKKRQIRYFPVKPLQRRSFREGAERAAGLLQQIMLAASRHHNMVLFLSAGLDSRIVLSACRDFREQMRTCTLQFHTLNADSTDIVIAQKLAARLQVRHDVIDCTRKMDPGFEELLHMNSDIPHPRFWGRNAYGLHQALSERQLEGHICVKGEVSPVARCILYRNGEHPVITSHEQLVSQIKGWEEVPAIGEHVRYWFEGIRTPAEQAGYNLLDLYYWEQRMGGWTARNQLEMDIVMDTFIPFNNRELLDLLLGVDQEHRCEPGHALFYEMIRILWVDALLEPVNPHKKSGVSARKKVSKWLKKLVSGKLSVKR